METHIPPDQPSRDRITFEHARNVVVEASAGTGKTTLLTKRVANLVLREGVPLENLAVVTFTEAAAAELRVRIRAELSGSPSRIGSAWITTIHGFAARVLREYPHMTGGYPDFSVETSHFSKDEQRMLWDAHLAGLSREDARECAAGLSNPGSESLMEFSGKLESIRWIEGIGPFGNPREELQHGRTELTGLLDSLLENCTDPRDRLATQMVLLRERLARGDGLSTVQVVNRSSGVKSAWVDKDTLDRVKAGVFDVNDRLRELQGIEVFLAAAPAIERIVLPCALNARRLWDSDRTRLSYDDLLFLAHRSVSVNPALRAALAARFKHILIDEFQDTSLLQANLFLGFLSAGGLEGRLTIVGDPKQSIYGWRSADVETYNETVELVTRSGALRETISTNFRSCRAVIAFVNAFGRSLFSNVPDDEIPFLSDYAPLVPSPGAEEGPMPLVIRLPQPPDGGSAAVYKGRAQAEAVAEMLTGENPGDWAILFKTATRLEELVEALDRRNIPYIVEASRDFKERLEVQDTAMLIRAVLDPHDRRARVHTLRSLYFGIDDSSITRWLSGTPVREVHEAESVIDALRAAATNLSPLLFLERVFRTTCITESVRGTGHEVNRRLGNLRSILERAGKCEGMNQLLDELSGVSIQASEEPSASPDSSDAVTLSTIHRAKGLDWKNVILLNPGAGSRSDRNPVLSDQRTGRAALGLRDGHSPYFLKLKEREKARTNAEFRRLLYVAVTRPRERLVIFSDTGEKVSGPAEVMYTAIAAAEGHYREMTLEPLDLESLHPRPIPAVSHPAPPVIVPPPEPPAPDPAASAKRLGTEVHALLEKIDLNNPQGWLDLNIPILRSCMEFADDAAKLALAFFGTPLPFDLSKARILGREYPLLADGMILYVDLLLDMGSHLEVIDFKTDSPSSLDSLFEQYRAKLERYAAVLERLKNKPAACRLVLLQQREVITLREPSAPANRGGGPQTQS